MNRSLLILLLVALLPPAMAQGGVSEPQDAWMVHLDVSNGELSFLPAVITLVPGGNVQLMVFGNDHGDYSLTLDDLPGYSAEVRTSEPGIVHVAEFQAPQTPGRYPFHDVHHPAAKGLLVVQAASPLIGVGNGYDTKFYPARIEVDAGQTFRFQNNASEIVHTMTATDGSFDTDKVVPGETRTLTAPSTPGEYPFICKYHEGMMGTLVVRAASAQAATPTPTATPPPADDAPAPREVPMVGLIGALLVLGLLALGMRRR